MSPHAGNFTTCILAGAVYLAASAAVPAIAADASSTPTPSRFRGGKLTRESRLSQKR
jgi:hypothetical protein